MANDTCVVHAQQYRVQIYREYLDLFDGDVCAAALLWLFEFSTNGETARLRLAEQVGDPWIKASVNSLVADMLGLYSARSVYERLAWLKFLKFVNVEKVGGGKINRYLLDFKHVKECLSTRRVFKLADCKIAASVDSELAEIAASDSAPDRAADCKTDCKNDAFEPVLNLKEEELQNEGTIHTSPEQLNRIFFYRYKNHRGTHLDSKRGDKQRTVEWIEGRSESPDTILSVLDLFLGDDYWRARKFPLSAYRAQFEQYLERIPSTADARTPPKVGQSSSSGSPNAPAAQNGAARGLESPLPDVVSRNSLPAAAIRWNGTVTKAPPVVVWPPGDLRDHTALDNALADAVFGDNFDKLLLSCQCLMEQGLPEKTACLTFGYMLNNWRKILNGGCNWMKADFTKSNKPKRLTIAEIAAL